jgi:hypothetical protein
MRKKMPMEKNLKLAILGQLMAQDIIPPFDLDIFFEEHLGQVYDGYAEYNDYPIPEVEAYLANMELNDDDVLQLDTISINTEDDVYRYIYPQWDGDGDYFAISSLEGIEICQNLTSLDMRGIASVDQPLDLTSLTQLPAFERLVLNGAVVTDLEPLLHVPTLKTLSLSYTTIAHPEENLHILTMLKDQGIAVTTKHI